MRISTVIYLFLVAGALLAVPFAVLGVDVNVSLALGYGVLAVILAAIMFRGRRRRSPDTEPEGVHAYDADDRREQLGKVAKASDRMADLYERHGGLEAESYRRMAAEARGIVDRGCDPDEVRALAHALPRTATAPDWMNPKAIDNGLHVERWQVEAAKVHSEIAELAIELRAIARY